MKKRKFFEVENVPDEIDIVQEVKTTKKIKKGKGLFDHLKAITQEDYDPNYFNNLSDSEKKTFSPYMINRYLSMNPDWIFLVNYVQKYSYELTPEAMYKVYANSIPKSRVFLKYIKGKKTKKYKQELLDIFTREFQASEKEVTEYLDILFLYLHGKDEIIRICQKYAMEDKEIKKLLK